MRPAESAASSVARRAGWAAAAGCSPSPEPTAEAAPGVYGPHCLGVAEAGSWRFSRTAADIAAQDAMDADMPTLGRCGTMTIQAVRLADGSGQATVTLSLNGSRSAIAQGRAVPSCSS